MPDEFLTQDISHRPPAAATLSHPAASTGIKGESLPPTDAAATAMLSPAELMATATAPTHVPGYEIIAELGRGGMGVVYKARHLKLNRIVALKMILSGGHASHTDLTRFLTEAEAVAYLQHPNIVQIFETGHHGGLPFFTLEFVEGGSLGGKVRDNPLPPKEAAQIVEQLARGVQYAHRKGVVHRDLKPGFYHKMNAINQRLADADPKNAQAQRDLSFSLCDIAWIHQQLHEFDKAQEWFEKAEKLAAGFSKPEFFPGDLPWIGAQIALCRNADKAIADLEFVFTQKPEQVPGLLHIRVKSLLKRQKPAEATASAERFAAWAETQDKDRNEQCYNAACFFALCAAAADEPAREKLVEQCVALLTRCRDGGYFKDAAKVADFHQVDSDFAGIRSQAKFQAFAKTLAASLVPK